MLLPSDSLDRRTARLHSGTEQCFATLAFTSLALASLHVVSELLFKHEAGHLHAFRAVEGCVGLRVALVRAVASFAFFLLFLGCRCRDGLSAWPLNRGVFEEELLIHLFFCHFKAVLEGLRAGRARNRLVNHDAIAEILLLLQLVLVLCLLQDPQQLELLPELLLQVYNVRLLCFGLTGASCAHQGYLSLPLAGSELQARLADQLRVLLLRLLGHLVVILLHERCLRVPVRVLLT